MSPAIGEVTAPATKFSAPAHRRDALSRRRLIDAMKTALGRARLTVLSAPAGAGKTTLLAELPHAFPERKWAWLLLDSEDNDPLRFAASFAAALSAACPCLRAAASDRWMTAAKPCLAVVMAAINQLIRSGCEPLVLAMDDFHAVHEPAVHRAVEYLVERLPPNLRVVVASRSDLPIGVARWRARGELAELRFHDLAFTEEETAHFVDACLRLSLSGDEVRELYARSEGWAAGLRLLATSMANRAGAPLTLLDPRRDGRHAVFEFLAEDVLNREETALRRFLLDTSILSGLNGPICDALTGRSGSDRVLETLYRRNLYIAVADEAGRDYRFHDLFAEFLRDRLRRERPADWAALHNRAAELAADPGRRIHHWMSAGNWAAVAAEIERVGPDYMRRGFAFTIRRWILEIPADVRRERPRLAYLLGCSIWARNEFSIARPFFEEALEGFRRLEDETAQGETLVALSITAANANDEERARALFDEALAFPLPAASRVAFQAATGWAAVSRRDWSVVMRSLDHLLEQLATPGVPFDAFAMHLLFIGTSLPEFTDRLDRAMSGIQEYAASCSALTGACCRMLRAACRLFRGDCAAARNASAAALSMVGPFEQPVTLRLYGIVITALTAFAEGDWRGVEPIASELTETDDDFELIRAWRSIVLYFVGRARWLAGDLQGLDECYRGLGPHDAGESPQTQTHRLLLAGMRHLSHRCYARAEEAFQRAGELEREHRLTAGHSSAAVLLAHTKLKRGDCDAAIEVFAPYAASLAGLNGPGWLLRENPVVIPLLRLLHEKNRHRDFIEHVLEMLGAPVDLAEAAGREPLSPRELEVLRVMAEGLSNRAIGERLFVGEATVKTHVQRLLRKLDASSRTEAVARAREWMLL